MKKLFLLSIIIVFFVLVCSNILCEKENSIFNFKQNIFIRVKRIQSDRIENVPFEDYVVGVVAGEMPVSFELEALKAQAVASRSYALTKMKQNKNNSFDVVDTTANQVYLDYDQLKSKWKDQYDANLFKIKQAVLETAGEYLVYNGEVINAFFFSTSVGKTENCKDVFGSDLPYLNSVDSMWDVISPVYETSKQFGLKEFCTSLGISYHSLRLEVISTTSTGRIKLIKINGKEFSGADIAKIFNLRSSFFDIKEENGMVTIYNRGYGHGVGMSQYGAYGMAQKGYKYNQILNYYYQNTELKKI